MSNIKTKNEELALTKKYAQCLEIAAQPIVNALVPLEDLAVRVPFLEHLKKAPKHLAHVLATVKRWPISNIEQCAQKWMLQTILWTSSRI